MTDQEVLHCAKLVLEPLAHMDRRQRIMWLKLIKKAKKVLDINYPLGAIPTPAPPKVETGIIVPPGAKP